MLRYCAGAVGLAVLVSVAAPIASALDCGPGAHAWHDPGAWQGGLVPSAQDDVRIVGSCSVTLPSGAVADARNVRVESEAASLRIEGTLRVHGCHDSSPSAGPFECGAIAGTLTVAGAQLHDSRTQGAIFEGIARVPGRADLLELRFLASPVPAGEALADGDGFFVLSGPDRGAVYLVDSTSCAPGANAACGVRVRLHDAAMEYGRNPETAAASREAAWLRPGALGDGGTARVAALGDPNRAARDLDHLVLLCASDTAPDGACSQPTALTENGAYTGWYIAFPSATSALLSSASAGGQRLLVLDGFDDRPARDWISADPAAPIDALRVGDPVPLAVRKAGDAANVDAVIWPGFWNTDDWALVRTAKVVYAGPEPGDGVWTSSGADTCATASRALYDGFATVAFDGTTDFSRYSACTSPVAWTVVVPWQQGDGVSLTQSASSGGCNEEALQLNRWDDVAIDHLAIVDSRTPVDTSASCCVVGGSGPSCAGGAGVLADLAPRSGTHGLSLNDVRSLHASELYFRYLGDDAIIVGAYQISGALDYSVQGASFWWMRQDLSGQEFDFAALTAGSHASVTLRDVRSANWQGVDSATCNLASFDAEGLPADFDIDGMLYLSTLHGGMVLEPDLASAGSRVRNAFLYGRDRDGVASSCGALLAGALESSWVDGWAHLVRAYPSAVHGVQWRREPGAASAGPLVGVGGIGSAQTIDDNLLRGLSDDDVLVPVPGPTGSSIEMRRNWVQWATPATAGALFGAAWSADTTPLAALDLNVGVDGGLLSCANPTWSAAQAPIVGSNLEGGSAARPWIAGDENCPVSAPQLLLPVPRVSDALFPAPLPPLWAYGPRGIVGVARPTEVLRAAFRVAAPAVPGSASDCEGPLLLAVETPRAYPGVQLPLLVRGAGPDVRVWIGDTPAPSALVGTTEIWATLPGTLELGRSYDVVVADPDGCRSLTTGQVTVVAADVGCGLTGIEPILALAALRSTRRRPG